MSRPAEGTSPGHRYRDEPWVRDVTRRRVQPWVLKISRRVRPWVREIGLGRALGEGEEPGPMLTREKRTPPRRVLFVVGPPDPWFPHPPDTRCTFSESYSTTVSEHERRIPNPTQMTSHSCGKVWATNRSR